VGPAIVEDDVDVSDVSKTGADEHGCGVEQERFRDVTSKGIPIVLVVKVRENYSDVI
jgi:hypothetical protein